VSRNSSPLVAMVDVPLPVAANMTVLPRPRTPRNDGTQQRTRTSGEGRLSTGFLDQTWRDFRFGSNCHVRGNSRERPDLAQSHRSAIEDSPRHTIRSVEYGPAARCDCNTMPRPAECGRCGGSGRTEYASTTVTSATVAGHGTAGAILGKGGRPALSISR
jgi:hypothetical protein